MAVHVEYNAHRFVDISAIGAESRRFFIVVEDAGYPEIFL